PTGFPRQESSHSIAAAKCIERQCTGHAIIETESDMNKFKAAFLLIAVCGVASTALVVRAGDDNVTLTAGLRGVNEVPAINSGGTASFLATIEPNGTITFTETFQNLTSNAILSHIH